MNPRTSRHDTCERELTKSKSRGAWEAQSSIPAYPDVLVTAGPSLAKALEIAYPETWHAKASRIFVFGYLPTGIVEVDNGSFTVLTMRSVSTQS